ncbi:MAG: hypothetical protein ABEJ92_05860 [Halobacteriales archaeon]
MRVRDWQDLVGDVVDRDVDPADWRAVAGPRERGIGEDLYLAHPAVGLYQLKTYAKNPFEVRGLGGRVARSIDDEIEPLLPQAADGRFAVQRPPADEDEAERTARRVEETVKAHAEAPGEPDALFDDLMDALGSPAYGPLEYDTYDRPDRLDEFAATFEDAESLLESEFEDLVEDDGVNRGFG